MKWLLQLKLILWKNFLLRKRQKLRCIAEFMWPLFLFLILMWVRTRGLRTHIDECHFIEKAMPSAGSLPFIQSFLCTFNNTCMRTLEEAEVHRVDFTSGRLVKLVREVRGILEEEATVLRNGSSDVRSALTVVGQLADLIRNISLNESSSPTGPVKRSYSDKTGEANRFLEDEAPFNSVLGKSASSVPIQENVRLVMATPQEVLCDPTNELVRKSNIQNLEEICSLTPLQYGAVVQLIKLQINQTDPQVAIANNKLLLGVVKNATILFQRLKDEFSSLDLYASNILRNISSIEEEVEEDFPYLFEDNENLNKFKKVMLLVHEFLCGNRTGDIMNQIATSGGKAQALDSLQDQFKSKVKILYKYDNTTTAECNKMMKWFQSVPQLRAFWDIMKPFVMGKIVFYPLTPATQRVMERVNVTFDPVRNMKFFFEAFEELSSKNFSVEEFSKSQQNIRLIKNFAGSYLGKLLSNETLDEAGQSALHKFEQQITSYINTSDSIIKDKDGEFNFISMLSCFDTEKVVGMNNLNEAHQLGTYLLTENKLWALIEFKDPGVAKLNPLVTYSIRMNIDKVDDTNSIKDRLQTPGGRIRANIDLKYLTYGFAYIQDMIDHSIIGEHTNRSDIPGIVFQQFPYPCYIIDQFIMAISRTFPLFMVLSWVYTCSMIVKSVVYEKEQRLKETMRVMGLSNGIHWMGWLIDSLVPMIITNVVLTVVLVYGKILTYSDPSLLFVFLLVYSLATISQSFLISVFFSKANLAAACAGTIFFVLYLPYPFLARWMYYLQPYQKTILSLSSNVALGVGASYFAFYEERGIGANWQNMDTSPLYGDDFSLGYIIYLLLFDFVLYMILTLYLEAVFPGQYGIPKPWYFPVTRSFWTGRRPRRVYVKPKPDMADTGTSENKDCFEAEPEGLDLGVSIVNLTKVYKNGKKAVDNISINFYQDQITSFLGHNGAGKTTTISILTGIYTPTEGTAFINGMDISTEMNKIRNNLGMCPQFNVLFNRLTVEEHLWFYGSLRAGKEQDGKAIRKEIEQMLGDLDLLRKRNTLPHDLSGGMQRKLSISVAFIGGSRTVILDEPTSGVDPYSRRSIWELLIKYKKGRTIILTTHFMDEADLLGDRIAIIANGKLQCCGSGVFLKSKLGDGYRLTVEMTPSCSTIMASLPQIKGIESYVTDPFVSKLIEHVKAAVPNAQFVEQIGAELTIVLPRSNSIATLIALFNSLEKNMNDLSIASYGISDTSLEEIFLRVAEHGDSSVKDLTRNSKADFPFFSRLYRYLLLNKSTKPFNVVLETGKDNKVKARKEVLIQLNGRNVKYTTVPVDEVANEKKQGNKYWRQYWALHVKKFHHTKRNPKALFAEIILPAVFVCMALIVCSLFPSLHERPPLQVQPFAYPKPRFMFYNNNLTRNYWMDKYISSLKGPMGLGTYCMENSNGTKNEECIIPSSCRPHRMQKKISWAKCSCESGAQVCPADIGKPPPPSCEIASGDTLYDMNGENISYWLVNTWPKYFGIRYGGYTFGSNIPVPKINITSSMVDMITAYEEKHYLSILKQLDNLQNAKTSSNNIKVWFNNKGWLSSVGYMNAINNVVLRASVNPLNASQYGINTINHPMNFTKAQLQVEMIKQGGLSLLLAISIIFSLSFVPASFTLYLIEERKTSSKHLQLVSGVNRFVYWLQTFTWDFCCYLVSAALCVFIFLIFKEEAYVSANNFPGLVLLLILYGWSCIPLMYPISFLFSVPSSAFVSLSCANVFIGIITTVTTFVLAAFNDPELKAVDNIIKEVFLIFPHFCLGDGLIKLATAHLFTATFFAFDVEFKEDILNWSIIGKNLTCMFAEGVVFSLLTLAVEFRIFSIRFRKRKVNLAAFQPDVEEDDVEAERKRIDQGNTTGDTLIMQNLTKIYRKAKKPSVNKVSVGVRQGECFGLLGLNGAGKTSTFKMLTGAIHPTSGDAWVKGHSVTTEIDKVRALLGYCPQFDALDSLLTPREHLLLYGRIKNIPSKILNQEVNEMLKRLSLGHYSDKLAGTLSGGNKRKLSTAIALLGNPSLIFMDEPTTGMDPKARRFLWTCIQDLIREGCCVVLTSHSMEECQALCTKLTIMVNGQFKCLGSSQHLKNKYGGGYSVVIRCSEDKMSEVKLFMESKVENSRLIEAHYNQLRYQIGTTNVTKIFEALENAKLSELVIDYSLSQTTLEDVFLRFANEQSDELKQEKKALLKRAFVRKCLICYSDHSAD